MLTNEQRDALRAALDAEAGDVRYLRCRAVLGALVGYEPAGVVSREECAVRWILATEAQQ